MQTAGGVFGESIISKAFKSDKGIANASTGHSRKIDVHNHLVPASYVAALNSIGIYEAGGRPFPDWTTETATHGSIAGFFGQGSGWRNGLS